MSSVKIKLKDGAIREVTVGATIEQLASSISQSLKRSAIGGKINGRLVDLNTPLLENADVEIIELDSRDGVDMLRHSAAHLMVQAIKRLYGSGQVSLGVGPVITDGFYYDVDIQGTLTVDDLSKIEAEMECIVKEDVAICRTVVSRDEAIRTFTDINDALKLELIADLPTEATISIYRQGEFFDLCRGPHVPSTGWIKVFKLLSVAGAYWRGDPNNKMLQRVYGTAFAKKQQLEEHLQLIEEARKRDHRKLGRELELFMFSEEAPGMPFYLAKGMIIRNELEKYERELQARAGYEEVRTPLLMNQRLWEQSGHWDHYHENMYFVDIDEAKFALKPMNCPGHMLIYKNKQRSYRDLPIRMAENGQVHRHELSGALNGMLRVRTFTQDDTHIFVRPDQIESEITGVLQLIDHIYGVFGFAYKVELSTRPVNSMGTDALWEQAESALRHVLVGQGLDYRVNEGDGVFYGPKIDFHIQDALKRSWQCATIQLDFQMPEKFDLNYVGEDSQRHRPVVIHRAIFGSIDRFLGMLTEHFAGAFPLWLAPVQARVVPIAASHRDYGERVMQQLAEAGIRVDLDDRNEKIGYKIREAGMQKIPYTLVVGDSEVENNTVSVRIRGQGDIGAQLVEDVKERVQAEIRSKQIG